MLALFVVFSCSAPGLAIPSFAGCSTCFSSRVSTSDSSTSLVGARDILKGTVDTDKLKSSDDLCESAISLRVLVLLRAFMYALMDDDP